eukprot:3448823-Alexandrium_andersonii.AAC.1
MSSTWLSCSGVSVSIITWWSLSDQHALVLVWLVPSHWGILDRVILTGSRGARGVAGGGPRRARSRILR